MQHMTSPTVLSQGHCNSIMSQPLPLPHPAAATAPSSHAWVQQDLFFCSLLFFLTHPCDDGRVSCHVSEWSTVYVRTWPRRKVFLFFIQGTATVGTETELNPSRRDAAGNENVETAAEEKKKSFSAVVFPVSEDKLKVLSFYQLQQSRDVSAPIKTAPPALCPHVPFTVFSKEYQSFLNVPALQKTCDEVLSSRRQSSLGVFIGQQKTKLIN